jgi:hypothetical protein
MVDGRAVEEDKDEAEVTLREVAPRAKIRFVYEYDFGDGWIHEILVERPIPPQPGIRYPICLKEKGRVRRKIVAEWEATTMCCKLFTNRSIRNSSISKNGWARISIPKHSTWIGPTGNWRKIERVSSK